MGIMVTKEDDLNADLTRRITNDLREKMDGTQKPEKSEKDPDLVEDSEYAKDFSKTSKYAWVWILVGVVIVVALIVIGVNNH